MRTRIKMCGTTRIEDAQAAVNIGIDALGFIFVPKSPRFILPDSAAHIIDGLPPFISRVGVFVNSEFDDIKTIVTACGLTQVQLHGGESKEFCKALKEWNRSLSICKAFRVGDGSPESNIDSYRPYMDSVLFDTYVKKVEGGTGLCFDWNLTDSLDVGVPLILAGGLNPDNIGIALQTVKPFAVDINSGVEDSPGIKNHQKLTDLVIRVRDHDALNRV